MKMNFSTNHLRTIFADEKKYENFKTLCYNLNHGIDMYEYDDEGNQHKLSKHEMNQAVRKIIMEVCGLDEESVKNNKLRKRAVEAHTNEVFELIEEDVSFKVWTGFQESEWFNQYVEGKNIALGDGEEFWTEPEKCLLVVAETASDYHDFCKRESA